jgi:hypothetical protein
MGAEDKLDRNNNYIGVRSFIPTGAPAKHLNPQPNSRTIAKLDRWPIVVSYQTATSITSTFAPPVGTLVPRFVPLPVELAFIREASELGDKLLETYFGESVVVIDGKRVNAHHGIWRRR